MRLATAILDVQPPRAGRFRKKIRRILPVRKVYYGVRDRAENVPVPRLPRVSDLDLPRWNVRQELPPWSIAWRMVAPGWSHFYAGHRVRGRWFLWSFLACLALAWLGLGGSWGAFWVGLAFSIHTSAAFDAFNLTRPGGTFRQLMARSILVSAVLALVVYAPAWWVLTQGAAVRRVQLNVEPFHSGDVVLVNRWFHRGGFPYRGQVVMYELPPVQEETNSPTRHEYRYFGGEAIDRVLAVAGDTVTWENGRLSVNGAESPLRPMNESAIGRNVSLTVPSGVVLILPSTTPQAGRVSAGTLQSLSLIEARNVTGTVYFRMQPLSRIKIIH